MALSAKRNHPAKRCLAIGDVLFEFQGQAKRTENRLMVFQPFENSFEHIPLSYSKKKVGGDEPARVD
jgi:hypothetical protein